MKKILLLFVFLLISQSVEAKIFRNYNYIPRYYNNYPARYNGAYYNHPRRYYNHRYNNYNNYPRNHYYNQHPVIYRQGVRRSMAEGEIPVSGQFSGLDNMERQIFNNTFGFDAPKIRIERLEQKVFGAIQNGTLEERFVVLKSAVKNYKVFNADGYMPAYENQYRPPVFTGTMGGNWKSMLLGNFRNQFTGTPTGFTPAMDPAYMDYFEAERAMMGDGQSSYQRTNHGYDYSNFNRGAKTGVTILD